MGKSGTKPTDEVFKRYNDKVIHVAFKLNWRRLVGYVILVWSQSR